MKVAINKCYGGFSLSDEAARALLTLKGIEFDEVYDKRFDTTNFYHKGHQGDKEHYIGIRAMCNCQNRTDADLIKVIEDLGERANGLCAELAIVEIPDDVQFEIDEYDGYEKIEEVHRSWS